MTSKNVKDSATKVDTYRVDITIDNQTRESILPLHETTRPHPSFIEWAGLNTHPPRTEHMSLPAPPYRLLRTTGGQFQSDEHGNLRCAALVSGPNAMLVMVLIVEMSLAGPQMTKVRAMRDKLEKLGDAKLIGSCCRPEYGFPERCF